MKSAVGVPVMTHSPVHVVQKFGRDETEIPGRRPIINANSFDAGVSF